MAEVDDSTGMREDDRVVRWEPVGPRWLGHRPEPLIHERLWACPLLQAPAPDGWLHEAGFDVDGRTMALRASPGAGADAQVD